MENSNFNLHFVSNNRSFDISFQEEECSKNTVLINGCQYALKGDAALINWLKKNIPELNSRKELSLRDIKSRLSELGTEDISTTAKIHDTVMYQLAPEAHQRQKALEVVINQASSLLRVEKKSIVKILQEPINQEQLDEAFATPIPWCCPPGAPPPREEDLVERLPILEGMTMRELLVLGTVATILDKNATLEKQCSDDFKLDHQLHTRGGFVQIEDDRQMYYQSFGEINTEVPCIVMQSGLGNDAGIWMRVKDILKEKSELYGLSYDRAGYGGSDHNPSENSGSIQEIVKDMDSMLIELEKEGFKPPYLLVGHSFGGPCMQWYASMNPTKVAGLVLVDSSDDEGASDPRLHGGPSTWTQQEFPTHLMPLKTAQALFPLTNKLFSIHRELESEIRNLELLNEKVKNTAKENFFDDLPIRILTSGKEPPGPNGPKALEAHLQYQVLLKRSSNSEQVILEDVGHFIQGEDPKSVVDAILSLL